jgi:hypothetical protein
MAADVVGGALQTARQGGFLNTVVASAPQVTSHLAACDTDAAKTRLRSIYQKLGVASRSEAIQLAGIPRGRPRQFPSRKS